MASTVSQAVESVLAQDYGSVEVIAVDDGSTDDSAAVVEKFSGRGVKLIRRTHRGSSAAYNAGTKVASSPYIAFLDADDVWLPEMLSRTVPILEREKSCSLVYTNATMLDEGGTNRGFRVANEFDHAPSLEEMLARYWPILPSMCVMRRSAFDAAGSFWEEAGVYRACADVYLMLRLRETGAFHYLPEPLVIRSIHGAHGTKHRHVRRRYYRLRLHRRSSTALQSRRDRPFRRTAQRPLLDDRSPARRFHPGQQRRRHFKS